MENLILGTIIVLFTIPILVRFGDWLWYVIFRDNNNIQETVPWSDVTVRIITLGEKKEIIQKTVDAISDTKAEIQVVSEKRINIDSADVYVVDGEFECTATKKGRALEWARRNLPKRDYLLYLNEDCELKSTDCIPKGEQVQLRQNPKYTNSLLSWYAEIQRVGVGEETYSFDKKDPKYIWAGGLMILSEIEDIITWDRESLNEDGDFIYRAIDEGYDYQIVPKPQIGNLSPLSFSDILEQRRKWNSSDESFIKRFLNTLDFNGSIVWILNALLPILLLFVLMFGNLKLLILIIPFYLINIIWTFYGLKHINAKPVHYLMVIFLVPIASFYNGVGNIYALINPITDYK